MTPSASQRRGGYVPNAVLMAMVLKFASISAFLVHTSERPVSNNLNPDFQLGGDR